MPAAAVSELVWERTAAAAIRPDRNAAIWTDRKPVKFCPKSGGPGLGAIAAGQRADIAG